MPDATSRDRAVLSVTLSGAHSSVAPVGMSTRIVAVDGQGGAGKSTFAERLALGLGSVQIVHTDDFASWDTVLHDHRDPVAFAYAGGVVELGATVGQAASQVLKLHPAIIQDASRLMVAVNDEYQDHDYVLNDNDEIALIPPVSGG